MYYTLNPSKTIFSYVTQGCRDVGMMGKMTVEGLRRAKRVLDYVDSVSK